MAPKKQQKPWQFTFSFSLALLMLALVAGYFLQSFNEIRQTQPVRVAIERVTGSGQAQPVPDGD